MLRWEGDDRVIVDGTTFRILSPADIQAWTQGLDMRGADFLVAKPRSLLERYIALIEALRPRAMFELGVYNGGSTALFAELARPRRLVAIDLRVTNADNVEAYASRRGLDGVVGFYGEVDQADRGRLAEISEKEFGGGPLDMVIDDCSHLYEPTRASFNELFPRLRPGGVYVIEDWPWAHTPVGSGLPDGLFPGEVPLTRLIFEFLLAIPSMPGLIANVEVDADAVFVTRGEAAGDPDGFDISECSNPRGRALLAPA